MEKLSTSLAYTLDTILDFFRMSYFEYFLSHILSQAILKVINLQFNANNSIDQNFFIADINNFVFFITRWSL